MDARGRRLAYGETVFRPLKTHQLVVDLVVAAVLLVVTLPGTLDPASVGFSDASGAYSTVFAVIVSITLCGAVAIRRLSPALALAIAWAGALLQMLVGLPPLPVDLAVFGVLYVTAAYGSRAVLWSGLASAFVAAGFISAYLIVVPLLRQGWSFSSLVAEILSFGVMLYVAAAFALLLAWTAGALVRATRRARANRRAQEIAETEAAEEQQRVQIARDMHDIVAHSLAVVIAQADGARYAAASDPQAATDALSAISATSRAALADVRTLLTQLRHAQGDGPQPTLVDLEALYAQVRAAGLELRVDVDPAPAAEPPPAVQLAIYRIVQEALTNALRHGDGDVVSVRLGFLPDRVELEVRNGVSEGITAAPSVRGHGIIGMRERAQLAGGRLDAGEENGCFVVRATIPLGSTPSSGPVVPDAETGGAA